MQLENLEVKHKAFGNGVVLAQTEKYITVRFATAEKIFVYPDSFEKYLTLADGTVSSDILAEIAISNAHKQSIIDKKNQENLHSMTHGIVIPGKEMSLDGNDDEESNDKNESEEI